MPPQLPRSIGPAGRNTQGRSMLVAPSSSPGVVLSQPPINTAPSTGWERSSSSVSIASMLRYIMLVGFTKLSDTDSAGSSTGKPPAISTPRFTSSTRCLKWTWHGCRSDQVLTMAITGRPCHSSGEYPICIARLRCPKLRKSAGPNQRAERRSDGASRRASVSEGVCGKSAIRFLVIKNPPVGRISEASSATLPSPQETWRPTAYHRIGEQLGRPAATQSWRRPALRSAPDRNSPTATRPASSKTAATTCLSEPEEPPALSGAEECSCPGIDHSNRSGKHDMPC